jgi:hypothetical protein
MTMMTNRASASGPRLPAYLAVSAQLAGYVQTLLDSRAVDTRQGNLEAVASTVAFQTDGAGLIPAGTFRTFFQDNLGQAAASGMIQTLADSNLFGGQIPSGVALILYGLGFSIECDVAFTSEDVYALARNLSILANLRGTPVQAGSVRDWPDILGPRGVGLGNQDGGTVPLDPPIVLLPLQTWAVKVTCERPVTLSNVSTEYRVHLRCPAQRIYDPLVLGKS